ncbi:hypothetical protein SLE2022_362230 [Rubroshorea leprosula]
MESKEIKKEADELHSGTAAAFSGQTPKSATGSPSILAPLSHTLNLKPYNRNKKRAKNQLKIKKCQSETVIKDAVSHHGERFISHKKHKDAGVGRCSPQVKSPAMIRAEEVQSNLEPAFPSLAKSMVRSHVSCCFWMGLPGTFCKSHLPKKDTMMVVEDESGKQFEIKYLADKTGLSAGWRQFCNAHNLLEGDVLVFQLVEPTKFKIYIIRANDLTALDGALGLLNLDACTKQNEAEMDAMKSKGTKRKLSKSLPLAFVQKKNKKTGQQGLATNPGQLAMQSDYDSEDVGSEVLEGLKLSANTIQFKDMTKFENFNILVDGLVIDSELLEDVHNKYYKLCCSQNAFLHESLIPGINLKLIVGTICETVNIADAIRHCKLTTRRDEFDSWDNSLKAFELLGMNVGFLRARLRRLAHLAYDSEGAADTRRYMEAKTEQAHTADEIRNLEAKLAELKGAYERFTIEIEELKSKAESYEMRFQEEVSAPW